MFNIPPNKVRTIFIVSKNLQEQFLSFLFDVTQYSWIERDFTQVATRLEQIGAILISDDDIRLPKIFHKFYEVGGIIYYFIGSKHLCIHPNVSPFEHELFVRKDQWDRFNSFYKNTYGLTFNEHIKEIK